MHTCIHTYSASHLDALQSMAGGARKGWLTTLVNVLKLNMFDLLSLGSNECGPFIYTFIGDLIDTIPLLEAFATPSCRPSRSCRNYSLHRKIGHVYRDVMQTWIRLHNMSKNPLCTVYCVVAPALRCCCPWTRLCWLRCEGSMPTCFWLS